MPAFQLKGPDRYLLLCSSTVLYALRLDVLNPLVLAPIPPSLIPTGIRERGVDVDVLRFEVKRFWHCIAPNCRLFSTRRHCEKFETRLPLLTLGKRDFDMIVIALRCDRSNCLEGRFMIYVPICISELHPLP